MEPLSVREVSERIDELLDELGQGAPPAVTGRAEELVQCVMALYGEGLRRIVGSMPETAVRDLAGDEVVGNLLVLHDLHPDDVDTRVQAALERVRPYLGSHAGGVSLSGVDEQGVVHLRLEGSCDGCPSSTLTVRSAIEDAILLAAPDVVAVEAEGMVEDGPALLQIQPFRPAGPEATDRGEGWQHLDLDVPPRTMAAHDVAGQDVVVANLDGTLVAYLDRCPACSAPLSGGSLEGDRLSCPAGHAYDARLAGRAAGAPGVEHLTPLPLLPERGAWKLSLPAQAPAGMVQR
ncbi:NifU family protein [Nocardioides sp. MAHUQ-72]|uniref:NifU family protein n=1 Tax=unclassified Nocardioides TaxID=2615069 RepID=UPI003622F983